MSLILDALKRAEQERNAGQVPTMDTLLAKTIPARSNPQAPPRSNAAVAISLVTLLVAIAVSAYLLWLRPQAAPAAVVVAAAPVIPAPAAITEQLPTAPPLRVDPERLEPLLSDEPIEDPSEVSDAASEPIPAAVQQLQPAPATQAVGTVNPGPALPEQLAEPAPVVISPPVPQVTAETVASLAATAVKPLNDMPASFRSGFPVLKLDVHFYDDNPLRRFTLINGKKYRETDTLAEGPRIVEISLDGVIVDHNGTKVLLELPR